MSFYQIRNRKLQKNCKKIKKIEKHHYALFFSQNKWGKAEKGRKKKIVSMSSYLNKNKKFQKNRKKFKKNKKIPLWHHFKPKEVPNG